MKSLIVHYQEIALKGKNRPWFVTRLVHNLRAATRGVGVREVRALMGRIEVVLDDTAEWDLVHERVARVFGVANFARAGRTPLDVEAIATAILGDLGPEDPTSFRVSVRRADKRFPMTSPEIEREVGGRIKMARGWHVDLGKPELTIRVETLSNQAFYSFGKQQGAGGLPTGVSGRVACLLSGGIDSPVAAWRMMRRGCRVVFVHFHSYPILSRASQEKARELAKLLTMFQLRSRLLLVPFGEIQQRVVLLRRASAARRDLPPVHDADRRGTGACESRPGARDRRGGWPGRVADGREPDLDKRGRDHAGAQAAHRHGQGRNHRRGTAAWHVPCFDHPGSGLLHAVHAAASGHARPPRRRHGGGGSLDVDEIVKQALAATAMEEFDFP